jgi:ADP-dependent NAD(P)H-hydrate dehydratase / NAD(P)H-hydrate epimerase
MKAITTAEMQELDRRTMREFDIPGEVLMERAGIGVAEVVRRIVQIARMGHPLVQLFAGRGNNGGDAFVAARYLKELDFDVQVFLAGETSALRGDALEHLMKMKAAGVSLQELPETEDWEDLYDDPQACGDILVDGLLGTGIAGPARGLAAAAIQVINRFAEFAHVVAIDAPSGLNTDTGVAEGDVVTADVTATMALPKIGLVQPTAIEYVGNLDVIDIGVPPQLHAGLASPVDLVTGYDVRALLARRSRIAHKGDFGHVLLIGGAPGYTGAMSLATMAATRSGAGLVTVLAPASLVPMVADIVPEAMVHVGHTDPSGTLAADAMQRWGVSTAAFSAILVGPGMGNSAATRAIVEFVCAAATCPVVLDADALNAVAADPGVLKRAAGPTIITPHPGELARLLHTDTESIQRDRLGAARSAAEAFGAVVVLKGAGTVICGVDGRPHVNLTGNPGMARGGMGDVLAGLLTGLAGQRAAPFAAACAAVYLHGRAGDNVALYSSQAGMIAGDVVEELPNVFRELMIR